MRRRRHVRGAAMTSQPLPEPANLQPDADDLLLARLAESDEVAFRELLERHLDRAYALALRILRHAPEAEAVAQAVMLDLWAQRHAELPGQRRLVVHLYREIVARCRNRQQRTRLEPIGPVAGSATEQSSASATHPGGTSSVLDVAMAQLPEPERIALIVSHADSLDTAELAEILGTTMAAVDSLLAQGRRQLRQLLRQAKGGAREPFTDN